MCHEQLLEKQVQDLDDLKSEIHFWKEECVPLAGATGGNNMSVSPGWSRHWDRTPKMRCKPSVSPLN